MTTVAEKMGQHNGKCQIQLERQAEEKWWRVKDKKAEKSEKLLEWPGSCGVCSAHHVADTTTTITTIFSVQRLLLPFQSAAADAGGLVTMLVTTTASSHTGRSCDDADAIRSQSGGSEMEGNSWIKKESFTNAQWDLVALWDAKKVLAGGVFLRIKRTGGLPHSCGPLICR